jgi:hypothetical protein
MAAAVYMVNSDGKQQPTPDATASSTAAGTGTGAQPVCTPVGTMSGAGTGYTPSGAGTGGHGGSKGRYSMAEAAEICKRVNACLAKKGVAAFEVPALLAFMKVESGFKKPHPGLIRFEPHVWKKRGGKVCAGQVGGQCPGGVPYRKGRKWCPQEGYTGGKKSKPLCNKKTSVDYSGHANTGRGAFDKAAQIDLKLAVIATSWGSFQVMGFNLPKVIKQNFGGSWTAFVQKFDSDPDEINVLMPCHFLSSRKSLQRALRRKDWRQVSKLYNGSYAYEAKFKPAYDNARNAGYA